MKSQKNEKQGKNNEPLSALTHLVAAILSVVALVVMVILASTKGSIYHIISYSIFGASLILLYLASTLYHFISDKELKEFFRRVDHSMIYVLIAGTYTPISLNLDNRFWGWLLFGLVWTMALAGIIVRSTGVKIKPWLSTALYIAMGWLALIAIKPLLAWLNPGAVFWLFCGGVLYTVGTIFFALDDKIKRTRWFGMHEIFHLFVIAGSFSHFWLMVNYVLYL